MKNNEMYSEVYSILALLGEEYINKLPEKLIKFIKKNKLNSYNPQYSLDKPLNEQAIQKNSIAMIVLLNYKYWAENDSDKREIFMMIKENK